MDFAASASVAGKGVHSSKHMVMSAPSWRWMAMLRSGVRRWLVPSMWLRKVTPSSSMLRSAASDITW